MIEWKNGYGRSRWQPVRCDGAKLNYICAMYYCTVGWSTDHRDHEPKVYRLRWMARFRSALGSWAFKRSKLKEIRPVT